MYYKLKKSNFEFNLLDESSEFKEHFSMVIEKKNKLFFVFKKNVINHENIIRHVIEYYTNQRGIKCKFLKN